LGALFEIADELDMESDEEAGFGAIGSNQLRMNWLINELVRRRLAQADRNRLFTETLPKASLGWAITLTGRLRSEHHPRNNDPPTVPDRCLVDSATARKLTATVLERIRHAAANGELPKLRHLLSVLFRWREFSDTPDEVKQWTDTHLAENDFVVLLAEAATSTSWTAGLGLDGMGDRVSRGLPYIQMAGLDAVLDVGRFLARIAEVEELMTDDRSKQVLARFREGMRRQEQEAGRMRPTAEATCSQEQSAKAEEEREVFRAAVINGEDGSD
jgi:hypothetical protein